MGRIEVISVGDKVSEIGREGNRVVTEGSSVPDERTSDVSGRETEVDGRMLVTGIPIMPVSVSMQSQPVNFLVYGG